MEVQRIRKSILFVFGIILSINVYLVSLILDESFSIASYYYKTTTTALLPDNSTTWYNVPEESSSSATKLTTVITPSRTKKNHHLHHLSSNAHKAALVKQNFVQPIPVGNSKKQPRNNQHTQIETLISDGFERNITKQDLIGPHSQVIADVSDMIDFAIIGNPKTGTTFLVEWMNRHAQLYLPNLEMRHLLRPQRGPALTVQQFLPRYKKKRPHELLGYKCPADVREMVALRHLRNHFPKTKLIVGLRHPVLWMESFYNYRIREKREIPDALECRGPCRKEHVFTCTYSGYFHLFLAQMGQTARLPEEQKLLRHYNLHNEPLPYDLEVLDPPAPHSVFLYDQNQIDGRKHPEIAEEFRRDMSAYLSLSSLLPSLSEATQKKYEAKVETEREAAARRAMESKLIDICQAQFTEIRQELVQVGRDMVDWIVQYYLPLPNVHVSQPDVFRQLLEEYKVDPCEKRKQQS